MELEMIRLFLLFNQSKTHGILIQLMDSIVESGYNSQILVSTFLNPFSRPRMTLIRFLTFGSFDFVQYVFRSSGEFTYNTRFDFENSIARFLQLLPRSTSQG